MVLNFRLLIFSFFLRFPAFLLRERAV
uniref:Uncharacterized protein n=1 Tax=Arundo donax TaxID=35708 RepID=A0A0A9GF44_ARUDO